MHPLTYQPAGPSTSKRNQFHLRTLGFAIACVWFALGIILATLMLAIKGFQEEASQPPSSLAYRAAASAIVMLVAFPGLLLAIVLRRKKKT